MTQRGIIGLSVFAWLCCGCGNAVQIDFPNRLIGADGQLVVLEDIEEIAQDPDLTDDQRRQRLRDLGIEDEELIEALLRP